MNRNIAHRLRKLTLAVLKLANFTVTIDNNSQALTFVQSLICKNWRFNMNSPDEKPGKKLIFRRYYVHPETGEKIYPKSGKAFPIWIDNDDAK